MDADSTNRSPRPSSRPSTYSSPPWNRTTKAIIASAALILLALATWQFRSLLAPIASAIILAYLINPLITFLQKKIAVSRSTAVLIVYAIIILGLAGGGLAIGLTSAQQVATLLRTLPDQTIRAVNSLQAEAMRVWNMDIAFGTIIINPGQQIGQYNPDRTLQQVFDLLQPYASRGGSLAAWIAQATVRVLSLSLLVFVLSIYVARDMPRFGRLISDIAHQPGYRQDADRLLEDFSRIWAAYLRGQVVLALVIGVVVTIALAAMGVNNALGLGALAGALEFLPIIGPVASTVAAVVVAFFQNEPFFGLAFYWRPIAVAVVMLVIQQIENNVLVPRIVGRALDLHPLVTMVAVLMGASLAGILGAVLAAPVVATLKLLGTYAWRKMLDLPPFADWETPPESAAVTSGESGAVAAPAEPVTDTHGVAKDGKIAPDAVE
jgi:predicted PurR-regulated permease PerM